MQRSEKQESSTLAKETTYTPGRHRTLCYPPAIDPILQLKWGLALLGEEKAKEYLRWLQSRLDNPAQ
jgi:hypothetical protein